MSKIKELEKLITRAQKAYYNKQPLMSDAAYDKLVAELTTKQPNNPALQRVGYTPDMFSPLQKVKHTIPMGSQNKVTSLGDFEAWAAKTGAEKFIIQEKIDGLSVELIYKKGKLIQAITRGDGKVGESITHNVVHMHNVAQDLHGFSGSLRGEIILFKDSFVKLATSHGTEENEEYKTPRGAASGIARRKTPKYANMLAVRYFDALSDDSSWKSEKQKLDFISDELGLIPAPYVFGDLDTIKKTFKEYADSRRAGLPYAIDGLVVKVNNLAKQEALGEVNGRPKGQMAWKFDAEAKETVLRDVRWDMGLTGRFTPVAVLEPVLLCDTTVKHANLHTWSNVNSLGVMLGDTVSVVKRGEIIPHVEELVTKGAERARIVYPKICPVCHAPTAFEGEFLVCPNASCPSKLEGDFKKWIKCLELDFLGDSFIEKIFKAYRIKGLWNLYQLSVKHIVRLPGFAEASAQRAYTEIHKRRELSLAQFLGALNIANAAESTFQTLVDAGYDTLAKIRVVAVRQLAQVHGVGDVTAGQITQGLRARVYTIDKLLQYITITKPIQGKLTGRSFCFTGEIEVGRSVAMRLAKENGGTVKSSVTKDLTYLVQADPKSQSGKSQKAHGYGVKIISGAEFLEMAGFSIDALRKLGQS